MACRVFIPPAKAGEAPPESPCGGVEEGKNKALPEFFLQEMAPFLCPACIEEFVPVVSPFCEQCGTLFKSREGGNRICGQCLEHPRNPFLSKARSSGTYETVLMALIQKFKYNDKIQLARPFGRLLWKTFQENWNSGDVDMILPVPLHKKKARRRGFNQSWLMIANWHDLKTGDFSKVQVTHDVLVRKRNTASQAGLSRSRREENIKDAFAVSDPGRVTSKRLVLVDDVFTTGATLNECARVLLKAGALQVDALTLARAR
jgi:ComF family protein